MCIYHGFVIMRGAPPINRLGPFELVKGNKIVMNIKLARMKKHIYFC